MYTSFYVCYNTLKCLKKVSIHTTYTQTERNVVKILFHCLNSKITQIIQKKAGKKLQN